MTGNPLPKDRPPNAASTHHFKISVPLALRVRGSMHVPLRYFIR
jgi:hypothetical protein